MVCLFDGVFVCVCDGVFVFDGVFVCVIVCLCV